MSIWIEKDEGTATRRRVPCRLFLSDGTSPDTGALNDAVIMGTNSLGTFSLSSTLRAVNAAHGMYCVELSASECSTLGTHPLYHTVGDFPQHIATVQVVNLNPFSTLSALNISALTALGVTRLDSSVTLKAGTHSGATVQGLSNYANISNVTLAAGTHSSVTIQGLSNYANISNVTLAAGTHSNVTIQGLSNYANISNVTLAAGTHSNVTIQGVTRALNLSANGDKTGYSISGTKTTLDALNDIDGSGVTLHAGTHSSVTIQGLSNYANISNVTLAAGTHSNVTIQGVTRVNSAVTLNADTHSGATIAGIVAGGILDTTLASGVLTSAKFAAGAIDAAALATDAGQEIADALLGRNIAGGSSTGRTVSEALYPMRNRSQIDGSTGTVYGVDDTTSAWTFTASTGTLPLSGIDPGGP